MKKMELLAPAGTVAVFEKAVDVGADAVYIGAPALNARAGGRDFSMAEIAAMISYAHSREVKVYLAMNSLLKEEEIPKAVETLAMLSGLKPDGLIIQDLGIYHLVRKYFPEFHLHASTLFGAHNSQAVTQFEKLGFSRVVLARELTLKEIAGIRKQCRVELEVFVHGALCFSYSGLCLFSSFHGGKSSLRGRCVQPCRRRYTWTGSKSGPTKNTRIFRGRAGQQSGYFFSMNDLSAIDLLPDLQQAGVSSLKIEGRLRSAQYVGTVVKAYKMVLDALPDGEQTVSEAASEAGELLCQAMGRRTTSGYFTTPKPSAAISPYHSGNIGIFLGRIKGVGKDNFVRLAIKETVRVGDRLRLHQEKSGERFSFTLKKIRAAGKMMVQSSKDIMVAIQVPQSVQPGDSLYKVDTKDRRTLEKVHEPIAFARFIKKNMVELDRERVEKVLGKLNGTYPSFDRRFSQTGLSHPSAAKGDAKGKQGRKRVASGRKKSAHLPGSLKLWLKIDDPRQLKHCLPLMPDRVILVLDRNNFTQFMKIKKYLRAFLPKLVWSLPPIIQEGQLEFYKKAVKQLIRAGFHAWQISHISQRELFATEKKVTLFGDYTLNVLNSQSLLALQELGVSQAQVAIETDKDCLRMICGGKLGKGLHMALGITVYGTPPLFTSRLIGGHFKYDHSFISPKGEALVLRRCRGLTVALSRKTFSLLHKLPELAVLGLQYVVVDLSHMKLKEKEMEVLGRRLAGKAKGGKLSSFNYLGVLQ